MNLFTKTFFLMIIFLQILLSKEIKILANKIDVNNSIIQANNNAEVFYQNYYISSDYISFNTNTSKLNLKGNSKFQNDKEFTATAKEIKLNLKTKHSKFSNLEIDFNKTNIWIKNKNCNSNDKYFLLNNSEISSCNKQNPEWKIKFSKGRLNKETKFVLLYDPIFYIKDLPVFWLPYFGFSANRTRTSGLLTPKFSHRSDEGFIYIQPVFVAPSLNYDIEVVPQIRTNRGLGIYSTLRFIDTQYSKGEIQTGLFKENSDYVDRENLKNDIHYGLNINYERTNLTNFKGYKDALYLDVNYLNDIDYNNLQTHKSSNFDKLIHSEINYNLRNDKQYFGFYSDYYIDTEESSNSNTIQT
ncbi:MAG: Outer membrane protein Imp, required for envelope biogenesis / Organic solvent tolerance protein precursor, partial [uncultured Campylobacterales bacterium]